MAWEIERSRERMRFQWGALVKAVGRLYTQTYKKYALHILKLRFSRFEFLGHVLKKLGHVNDNCQSRKTGEPYISHCQFLDHTLKKLGHDQIKTARGR